MVLSPVLYFFIFLIVILPKICSLNFWELMGMCVCVCVCVCVLRLITGQHLFLILISAQHP